MEIHAHTPRAEFTIAGEVFNGYRPYAAGHTVTENEAAVLNQTLIENARNNFSRSVKDAKEAGTFDQAALQGALEKYFGEYEFGVRHGGGGGGRTADPVATRAMELAREAVRKAIRERGGNLKDYPAADITARARKAVETNPRFKATAEKQIADEETLGDVGDLDSLPPSAEKPARAKKSA